MAKRSDWNQSSIDRRDFRNSKDEPEIPPHRRKPEGKHVCRKNKGAGHEFTERVTTPWYAIDTCKFCGKHGKYYFFSR